jgi:FkbM family methyltransferase
MLQASEARRTPSAGVGVVQKSAGQQARRRVPEFSRMALLRQSGVREPAYLSQPHLRRVAVDRWLTRLKNQWSYLSTQKSFCCAPAATAIRLIWWCIRCILGWPATVTLRPWNVKMFLPANWCGIEKLIYAFGAHYEPELAYLKQVLSPGSTFVDAGACYGVYTLAASTIVGRQGRVIAFEPAARAFRVLQHNLELNGVANVKPYPAALTEKEGKTWLYHHPNVGCDSLGRDGSFTDHGEEVETESLDNVLCQLPPRSVDVMKLDVQGAEELLLRGALATLRAHHPVVIFEVYPEGAIPLGLAPYGAWQLLEDLGYQFFVVENDETLTRVELPPVDRNVVAIYQPSERNVLIL